MVLLKQPDDKITIVEHLSFPEKIKLQMLKKSVYGSPFKPRFMSANPKAGRKKTTIPFGKIGRPCFHMLRSDIPSYTQGRIEAQLGL
jgi:hypothetical protein